MTRPSKTFLILAIFSAVSISFVSCRSARSNSAMQNTPEDSSLSTRTDNLLDTVTTRYLDNRGLRGIIYLTYSQLIALGKLELESAEAIQSRGLSPNMAKEELAFYGVLKSGGLVSRGKQLSKDVGDEVQKQNVKRGLLFKIQLIRATLSTSTDATLPANQLNYSKELTALEQAVEALPAQ